MKDALATQITDALRALKLPAPDSHKGQNGKLLLIGGSELFHAASKWSLDVASYFVDMVFYSSVPANNTLITQAKGAFWNGIVVPRETVSSYALEADCILIGPGMDRTVPTEKLVNMLLAEFSQKKWVVDAGALQMVDPERLNQNCIITPHQTELERVTKKKPLAELLKKGVTVLVKGQQDTLYTKQETVAIAGGNPGMTKGGTGDVLAGLVAALYCNNSARTAALVGSYVNKKAGEDLSVIVGPFFNASQLSEQVPKTLWRELTAA